MSFFDPDLMGSLPDVVVPDASFWAVKEIDFDVDLRELQGQERLDVFCGFLRVVGRRLGKPVLMVSEGGDHSHPLLGFDVETDQVVLLADPLVT